MKFQFNITDNAHKIIGLLCSNLIEIILLAYYASYDLEFSLNTDFEDDFRAFKGLSVTGSLFMMITWFIQIVLIYKYHQKALYLVLVVNTFSIFILLVGMGMGTQGINKYKDLYGSVVYSDDYNFPVALWFIQLCLYIMSLVNLHNMKQKEGDVKKEDVKKKEEVDDSKKQGQNTSTQPNQSQLVMMGNNESQFTQQQQVI